MLAGLLNGKNGGGGADEKEPEVPKKGESYVRKRLNKKAFSREEDREELCNLDYTPVCNREPVDFNTDIRCKRMGRKIRMFMCITMYNEDREELKRSLTGVAANLDSLEAAGLSWQEFLIVMVVDGRHKANKGTLEYMQKELKVYDGDMLLDRLNHSDVTMHLFERTVQLHKHTSQGTFYQPMQLMLALKEKNGGKLNSHLWYFSGFCKKLSPKYTFLLDVGTQPRKDSLAKLYARMEEDSQIAGVCGEIAVRNPRVWHVLESSQHFEYKISHVLDKAMESVFGYITVLPGAFSAYRWEAINGQPLNKYFYVEENSLKDMGPFMANMYLAEDRVLCFELVARDNCDWILSYVKNAVAETDVPQNILELIKQRRRWLNGSFFSLVFYITNFPRFNRESAHTFLRKILLNLQFLYQLSNLVLNWFTVGSLYLSLVIVFNLSFESIGDAAVELKFIFSLCYTLLSFLQFLVGLGGKANDTHRIYFVCFLVYGVIMTFAMVLSVWHLLAAKFGFFIVAAALVGFGAYAFSAFMHGELAAIVFVVPQYLFMLPTFVNMFTIYSFCNMHDVSWGTKEGNSANEKRRTRQKGGVAQQIAKLAANGAMRKGQGMERAAGMFGAEKARAMLKGAMQEQHHVGDSSNTLLDIAALAAQAEADAKEQENNAKVKAEFAAEVKVLESEFASFRTRLVALWIACNWSLITVVTEFELLGPFATFLAVAILWTLMYRLTGSIVYMIKTFTRSCWRWFKRTCCPCCCKEKSRRRRSFGKDQARTGIYGEGQDVPATGGFMGGSRLNSRGASRATSRYGAEGMMTSRSMMGAPAPMPGGSIPPGQMGGPMMGGGYSGNSTPMRVEPVEDSPFMSVESIDPGPVSDSHSRRGPPTGREPPPDDMMNLSKQLDKAEGVTKHILAREDGAPSGKKHRRKGDSSSSSSGSSSSGSSSSGSSSSGSDSSSDDGGKSGRNPRATPGRTVGGATSSLRKNGSGDKGKKGSFSLSENSFTLGGDGGSFEGLPKGDGLMDSFEGK